MRGALWPLYVVVFRPGFIGLLSACIGIAFLTNQLGPRAAAFGD